MKKLIYALLSLTILVSVTTKAWAQNSYYIPLIGGAGWSLGQDYPTDYLATRGGDVVLNFTNYPVAIYNTLTPSEYFTSIIDQLKLKSSVVAGPHQVTRYKGTPGSSDYVVEGWVKVGFRQTNSIVNLGNLITFRPN